MRLAHNDIWPALIALGALLLGACADDATDGDPGLTAGTGSPTNGTVANDTGATVATVAGTTGQTAGTTSTTTGVATGTTTGVPTGTTTGVPTGTTTGVPTGTTTGTTPETTGLNGSDGGGVATTTADGGVSSDAGSDGGSMTDGATDAGDAGDAGAEPDATVTPDALWKFVGNITTNGEVRPDFDTYWDQLTPENEGKWGSVERTRDQMNWGPLDAAHDYAKARGLPFKQHTFVWGSQQPDWIAGLSAQEQREEVEEWIRLYCERYPDTQMIDVVNEPPPHTTPSYMNAIGGAGASGWDWIVQSFQWARQYCPNAILILNDYNIIEYPNDNAHIIDITKRILAAGAPVDAVGVQAHDAHKLPTQTVRMYIDRIADQTGLPIYVSEYDISEGDDERQRQIMASQFEMFWRHEDVAGITLWGYVEGATWLPNTGLMSNDGQPRPAMTWLMNFLEQERR